MSWEGFEEELRRPRLRKVCPIAGFLADLEDKDKNAAATVADYLDRREVSAPALYAAISKRTSDCPTVWQIRVHRRRECACHR